MEIVDDNSRPVTYLTMGRKNKYKWDEWLVHGKTVRIVQGKDFDVPPATLFPQIYNAAQRRSGKVEVRRGLDHLNHNTMDITFTLNHPISDEEINADLPIGGNDHA